MSEELKPCPFCGEHPTLWDGRWPRPQKMDEGRYWQMTLDCCDIVMSAQCDWRLSEDDAAKKLKADLISTWNNRAEADQLRQRVSDQQVEIDRLQKWGSRTRAKLDDLSRLDKGPWVISLETSSLQSDDFEHDVTLRVSGDFRDDHTEESYLAALRDRLNNA